MRVVNGKKTEKVIVLKLSLPLREAATLSAWIREKATEIAVKADMKRLRAQELVFELRRRRILGSR